VLQLGKVVSYRIWVGVWFWHTEGIEAADTQELAELHVDDCTIVIMMIKRTRTLDIVYAEVINDTAMIT